MNGLPPVIEQSNRRTGWIVYSVIVTFLLFVSVLGNFVLLALLLGGDGGGLPGRAARYQEQFINGEERAREKIVVIYLTGLISSTSDGYTSEEGLVGDIREQLRQAIEDRQVKAIVLRINSAGGEVVASDAIYQAVAAAREQKPVVASIDSLGASGGYYVAVGASYIIANELSITGSIGVILQTATITGLAEKVGVKFYTFKSGRYKDLLNPTREPTEDEKALVQELIAEVYEKFVGIVAKERSMNAEELKNGLADGRILSGRQALASGFIDQVGYFEDAIDKAKALAGIETARVVRYLPPFTLRNLLRLFGGGEQAKIRIEWPPNQLKLEPGKLYFLPPYMFE